MSRTIHAVSLALFQLDMATLLSEASDDSQNLAFDLTCGIIRDIQIKFCYIIGKFMPVDIKYRFLIENLSSTVSDSMGVRPFPYGGEG